jgi:hypothetical protein
VATGPEYAGEKAVLIDMGSATWLKASGLPWLQRVGLLYLHSSVFYSLSIDRADEFAYNNWRVADMFAVVRKNCFIYRTLPAGPKHVKKYTKMSTPETFPIAGF